MDVLNTYTIQQVSTNRYLDAYEDSTNDYRTVTRTDQNNDSQRWVITYEGNDRYTIQQASNNRFLDAYDYGGSDYLMVTRTAQNNAKR